MTGWCATGSDKGSGRDVEYTGAELWEIELAWATTVHKAQGSESKAVVVVLSPAHRPLLTRRLFYTGARPRRWPDLSHRPPCFMPTDERPHSNAGISCIGVHAKASRGIYSLLAK